MKNKGPRQSWKKHVKVPKAESSLLCVCFRLQRDYYGEWLSVSGRVRSRRLPLPGLGVTTRATLEVRPNSRVADGLLRGVEPRK